MVPTLMKKLNPEPRMHTPSHPVRLARPWQPSGVLPCASARVMPHEVMTILLLPMPPTTKESVMEWE